MSLIGAEQDLVDRWVETTLKAAGLDLISAGLTGRIYNEFAPRDAKYPFIIYQAQSPARDIRGVGAARVMVETIYIVKAVAQTNWYMDLAPIAAEIDRVMTSPNGVAITGEGFIFTSIRQGQFRLVEVEDGQQFRHFGGEYQIHAQATA